MPPMSSQESIDHWRGTVDARLVGIERSNDNQSETVSRVDARVQSLEVQLQVLATKVVIYSALGATLGSMIMSIIMGVAFKTFTK